MNEQVPSPLIKVDQSSRTGVLVIVGVVLGIGLLIGFILPELGAAHEPARRTNCALNLKQIGMLIALYAKEHNGEIPRSFDDLHPYIVNNIVLICPSAKDKSKPSYQILAGGQKWNSWSSMETTNAIVATEPLSNHSLGRNALYGDGHVAWLSN